MARAVRKSKMSRRITYERSVALPLTILVQWKRVEPNQRTEVAMTGLRPV